MVYFYNVIKNNKPKLLALNKLSIIEASKLIVGKVCDRIANQLQYRNHYKVILNEISYFLSNGYRINCKSRKYIIVSKIENLINISILIRKNSSDTQVFKQVLIDKEYFPIIKLIELKNESKSIKLIVDAGANMGLSSVFFNYYFPNANIIAIEPELSNFNTLQKNILRNSLVKTILPINKALWINSSDSLTIANNFRDGKNWSCAIQQSTSEVGKVEPITLKEIVNQYATEGKTIDIMKIDIEGSEAILFENESFVDLVIKKVRFLCIEIHHEKMCNESFLEKIGTNHFEVHEVDDIIFCCNKSFS